jgi:hypothetical protein
MKKGKLTEEYKIINNGELSYITKFKCKDEQIYEDEGKQYLMVDLSDGLTLLLPIESVEDYVEPPKEEEKEKSSAAARLRKLFSKKM